MDDLDLTGRWNGRYEYPTADAVSFVTRLTDLDGWLSGTTDEVATVGEARGHAITATLQGKRDGLQVRFLKLYDGASGDYDAVAYEGQLSSDGLVIIGTWRVQDDWSGTFVMARQREVARAAVRRTVEKV